MSSTDCPTWAHPRPCGEHPEFRSAKIPPLGSSPPVRGALLTHPAVLCAGGLIPARAGSTPFVLGPIEVGWAHPRPCGEHAFLKSLCHPVVGSSPPVRGAQYRQEPALPGKGLIPARAGSTKLPILPRNSARAHPRPCGEHLSTLYFKPARLGSSPPVRGARVYVYCR